MTSAIASLGLQRDRFLGFVERRVHDRAQAEDILQAAYARAIDRQAALRDDESATAWFFRILRNAIIDHYRHHAVEGRTFEPWTPEHDPEAAPFNEAPPNTCRCLAGAIDRIHPNYREVIQQVDLDESPLGDFARRSGITAGNAAVRSHRAHQALRKQLLECCGACARTSCLDCTCDHTAAHQG
ncbi:MAG TPA: RNA polymerase sigma factor [Edaphobacter sp.]